MNVTCDVPELTRALDVETQRVAADLRRADQRYRSKRQGPGPQGKVPGLDWTAMEAATHLVVVLESFALVLAGADVRDEVPDFDGLDDLPDQVAGVNAWAIATFEVDGLAAAADRIEKAGRELSALIVGDDLERDVQAPWYGKMMTRTAGNLYALAVSETLLHGWDIAGGLGLRRRIPQRSARAAAAIVMSEMLPLLVDRQTTRKVSMDYLVKIRGAQRFTIHVEQGRASSDVAWTIVDCVVSIRASTALLLGFRRISQARAIASGGVFSTGPKPWLGLRFGSFFKSA